MAVISKDEFSSKVLEKMNGIEPEFIDAILTVCAELNIEPESCSTLLSDQLVTLLELEARHLNLIKNGDKRGQSIFF